VFSKVDANSGFWQIPLSEDSRLLTTFITPYGRYCYNKLPFRICSAPELFQSRMNKILEGLQGVVCHMDDMLIYGANKAEHKSFTRSIVLKSFSSLGHSSHATFGYECHHKHKTKSVRNVSYLAMLVATDLSSEHTAALSSPSCCQSARMSWLIKVSQIQRNRWSVSMIKF